MGTGNTPARVRAVLLPPRPSLRPALGVRPGAPAPAALPAVPESLTVLPEERATAAAEASRGREPLVAVAAPTPEPAVSVLPLVAPKQEPVPKHLMECRVSVVPRLPVVALEKPSSAWPDLTPSPVPRVSLIPPTGRIERHPLAPRNLPTVAPRLRAGGPLPMPAPAATVPHLLEPAPLGRLARLMRDLRSSKREIALGLAIGIGLSLLLGKLGQTYLESRRGGQPGAIEQWTATALPSPEPRSPALPASPAAVTNAEATGATSSGAQPATTGGSVSAKNASPEPAAAAVAAAPVEPASRGERARAASHGMRSTRRHRAVRSTRHELPPIDRNPWRAPADAPGGELESRGKTPLTPSESAGLGRELPL